MEIAVPTLSSDGFVTDIRMKADTLTAYYFASDYSQSNVFAGDVISLSSHIQRFGHDTFELKQQIGRSLESYYAKHFETARVDVSIEESNDSSKYSIILDVVVTNGELKYSLGQLIDVQNQRIARITKRMDTGA